MARLTAVMGVEIETIWPFTQSGRHLDSGYHDFHQLATTVFRLLPDHCLEQGIQRPRHQASRLEFPTPGYWEVEARTDKSVLRFVIYVYPGGREASLKSGAERE
ncbi:hypothetical protein HY346_00490 [Candidatus Microgenomates bacterium]|nr:hypothetical protein [Candidatus Microgenomates bacterium]